MNLKRIAVAVLSAGFLILGVAPSAPAQDLQIRFDGSGSARAADLAIPALRTLPSPLSDFKGITVGATHTEFSSAPSIKGLAAGQCELLGSNPDFSNLPCTEGTFQTSSAPGNPGAAEAACIADQSIAVVGLKASCGNSVSSIDDGMPLGLNEAKVSSASLSLDLDELGLKNFLDVESNKDAAVDALAGVVEGVLGDVQPLAPQQVSELKEALGDFLDSVKVGTEAGRIRIGAATTNVTGDANTVTVTSEAAGGKLGLLGITDAFTDGLIIIEVSAGKATASFSSLEGISTASATPAVATVKVRDLIDLVPGDEYLTASISPDLLNDLLANLNGLPLETKIEVATATEPQQGKSVSASTTGVGIRALMGLSETSPGAKDGGLTLRLAAADVAIAGDVDKRINPPLPVTGGPVPLFLVGAAVLAISALALIRWARRLRSAA